MAAEGTQKQREEQADAEKPSAAGEDQLSRGMRRWLGLGVELAGVLAIFSYGGWRLDQWLGHRVPWLAMVGFGVSFVGMMYLLWRETEELRRGR